MGKGKLKIEDNISDYHTYLTQAVRGVSISLGTIKKLKTSVDGMRWKGESRNHFVALLDIIYHYHQDMEEIGEEFKNNINSLSESVGKYQDYTIMKSLTGIE